MPTLSPKPALPQLKTIPQRSPTPVGAPLPEPELVIYVAALPPSLSWSTPNPSSKRRRVTISGVALNTSILPSADGSLIRTPTCTLNLLVHAGSLTPISHAAMGFSIQWDDPTAIEQARAMLSVACRAETESLDRKSTWECVMDAVVQWLACSRDAGAVCLVCIPP